MTTAATTKFPDNLSNLHGGEEHLRNQSVAAIEAAESICAHVSAIESAMDLIDYYCRQYKHRNPDELTIQLLGIRLFNGSASALKLLLSGYYQTSALQERDLLETAFLLDLFTADKTLIAAWHSDSDAARFKPVNVRKALDDRDGFTEKKRAKAYKLLCELAGHPSGKGFRMLTAVPGGDACCGPFFDLALLTALLEELAKLMVQAAGAFTRLFSGSSKTDYAVKIAFMEAQGSWFERFYGRRFDTTEIENMRALLARLPNQSI